MSCQVVAADAACFLRSCAFGAAGPGAGAGVAPPRGQDGAQLRGRQSGCSWSQQSLVLVPAVVWPPPVLLVPLCPRGVCRWGGLPRLPWWDSLGAGH